MIFTQTSVTTWKYTGSHIETAYIKEVSEDKYKVLIMGDYPRSNAETVCCCLDEAQQHILMADESRLPTNKYIRKLLKVTREELQYRLSGEVTLGKNMKAGMPVFKYMLNGVIAETTVSTPELISCGSWRSAIVEEIATRLIGKINSYGMSIKQEGS